MQEGRFSRTAHGVAVRRATHQLFDQPKVLDDPFALPIIGAQAVEKLRARLRANSSIARAFRAFMAARSRYAEDHLAKAVERGVAQYISKTWDLELPKHLGQRKSTPDTSAIEPTG